MSDPKLEAACTATVSIPPSDGADAEENDRTTKIEEDSTNDQEDPPSAEKERGDAPDFNIYRGVVEDALKFSQSVAPISLENRPKILPSDVEGEVKPAADDAVDASEVDNKAEKLSSDPNFLSSLAPTEADKKLVSTQYEKLVETPNVQSALKNSDVLARQLLKKYFPEDADFPEKAPSASSREKTLTPERNNFQFLKDLKKGMRRSGRTRSACRYFLRELHQLRDSASKLNSRLEPPTCLYRKDSGSLREDSLDDFWPERESGKRNRRPYRSFDSCSSIVESASVLRYFLTNGTTSAGSERKRPESGEVDARNICDIVLYEHVVLVNFINLFYGYSGIHVAKRRSAMHYFLHVVMYSVCLFACCYSDQFWVMS